MRPLPLLLTTLLAITSLSPETQAQSKPTTAATPATTTKSIDQLVAKINADIKAKRTSEQVFWTVGPTWKEVRSKRELAEMQEMPEKDVFTIWRAEDHSILKVDDGGGTGDGVRSNIYYFRPDGSLAKFEWSSIGFGVGDALESFEIAVRYDESGQQLSFNKSAVREIRKKKVPIAFPREMGGKPSFMHASQVASFRNRR